MSNRPVQHALDLLREYIKDHAQAETAEHHSGIVDDAEASRAAAAEALMNLRATLLQIVNGPWPPEQKLEAMRDVLAPGGLLP